MCSCSIIWQIQGLWHSHTIIQPMRIWNNYPSNFKWDLSLYLANPLPIAHRFDNPASKCLKPIFGFDPVDLIGKSLFSGTTIQHSVTCLSEIISQPSLDLCLLLYLVHGWTIPLSGSCILLGVFRSLYLASPRPITQFVHFLSRLFTYPSLDMSLSLGFGLCHTHLIIQHQHLWSNCPLIFRFIHLASFSKS